MDPAGRPNSFAALRTLARRGPQAEEGCESCNEPLRPEHRHLLDLPSRKIACVCHGCVLRVDEARP